MKTSVLIFGMIIFLSGCGGPAFPERNAEKYLQKKGYSPDVISAVLSQQSLAPDVLASLQKLNSKDVHFLLAKNPSLSADQLTVCLDDPDDFVRSGAAMNPNLTLPQIEKLFQDPSETVICKLAANPSVPRELLLRLHRERDPGLLWFAYNPNCPQEIIDEIVKSDASVGSNFLAKKALKDTVNKKL